MMHHYDSDDGDDDDNDDNDGDGDGGGHDDDDKQTPEGSEDGVEDGSWMIKQIGGLGVDTDVREVPVGTDLTERTHLVLA